MQRNDDSKSKVHFRTDRIFEANGHWYFLTREDTVEGPFGDELEANTQIEIYIQLMNSGMLPAVNSISLEESAEKAETDENGIFSAKEPSSSTLVWRGLR
jgi:hypothetical protein